MPIFTRRRLCSMLDELSTHMDTQKLNALSKNIEHVNTNTALAAEAELAVLWAVSQVAHMIPEPALPNSNRRPDAKSDNLFLSKPAIIEVRAISDDSFSGKEAMDRTANIISGYADKLRKGAGKHLYFEYNERSYYTTRFHRERCVDPSFELTAEIKSQMQKWVKDPNWPNPEKIRISHGKTDVIISWKKSTVPLFRTFCKMPSVAYDLEKNPIFKALKSKSKQIKGADGNDLRCVILVDVGCSLLRRLRSFGGAHEVGGDTIINHALTKLSIDVVIVLSPFRKRERVFSVQSELIWNVSCFDSRASLSSEEYDRLEKMAAELPRPSFEGYQARDLHKQGSFSLEKRNWYLPTTIKTGREKMTIKLSAGLLHEYLAGHIDADQFRQKAFNGENNFFDTELKRGNSIRNLQLEPGGIDEDDDYAVFELDVDWDKIAAKK